MPKIIATTTVRNESDIVESFCRYTLTFCDQLIINDNSSKDNTTDIIRQLVDEGLPIVFLQNLPYVQLSGSFLNNQLLRIAMEEYGADIVVPIDVDEFLVTASGENPRAIIEAIDPFMEHLIPWRTYVYTCDATDNSFLPDNFPLHRADEVQQFYKTIMSRQIYFERGCTLTSGSHNIKYPDGAEHLPSQIMSNLCYAHYPIRNCYQAVQKSALSFFNCLMYRRGDKNSGFQYYDNYDRLMETGWFKIEDVTQISKYYALSKDSQDYEIDLIGDRLDPYSHARPLELKYTNYLDNQDLFLTTLLSQIEEMLNELLDEKELQSMIGKEKDDVIASY